MVRTDKTNVKRGTGSRRRNGALGNGRTMVDFRVLSHKILRLANREMPRADFLRELLMLLLRFTGCDGVELWLKEDALFTRCRFTLFPEIRFQFQVMARQGDGEIMPYDRFGWSVFSGKLGENVAHVTRRGSFWTGQAHKLELDNRIDDRKKDRKGGDPAIIASLAMVPLTSGGENVGLLHLKSAEKHYFKRKEIEHFEDIAGTLGGALINERAQAALRERVKELTCLYEIERIARQPDSSLEDILQRIAALLPPAWQYPEITAGRIDVEGRQYETAQYRDTAWKQSAEIKTGSDVYGVVEVVYLEEKPELDEGPFLKEERSLINAVAHQVAQVIERKRAEEEKTRLQDQLRHADRLATIGQLAAGVAHELNEPLGAILGFAQLVQKTDGVPEQTSSDVGKIIKSSLHAREVVKKLRLFARESPPQKDDIDLNEMVEEGLYFVESRCAKGGIRLVRSLKPGLPLITADRSQLHQVLVNLVVNAIQAMPDGGVLTIRTDTENSNVSLTVEDTGIGMSRDVINRVFVPFFTTKDVHEGTGLGLAVVHGIVSAHGGTIIVESEVGEGSKFIIRLPAGG